MCRDALTLGQLIPVCEAYNPEVLKETVLRQLLLWRFTQVRFIMGPFSCALVARVISRPGLGLSVRSSSISSAAWFSATSIGTREGTSMQ